jgi:alpha-ketoglutarate-dependent taurine dioxygenase
MEAAWEGLSAPMKGMLEGLSAVHSMRPTVERDGMTGIEIVTGRKIDLIESIHPLVTTHPETGRKALFVSECSTLRIVELSPLESMQVLTALFLHIRNPEYQVRWRWQAGDLALWDNRSTQHFAVPDYEQDRVMQRIELAGARPA